MNIVTFNRPDTKNIGDIVAPWYNYFPEKTDTCSIRSERLPVPGEYKLAVFGGGMYPKKRFESWIRENEKLGAAGTTIVGWGVGSNTGRLDDSAFSLFSQRENYDNWAPCPSCMLPRLSELRDKTPTNPVVFYQNDGLTPMADMVSGEVAPLLGNHHDNLDEVLEFLASAEVVITSSYHGMFWATLLGRKVGAIPIRPKLHNPPWPPVYLDDPGAWRSVQQNGTEYLNALEQARERTAEFYEKFRALVEKLSATA